MAIYEKLTKFIKFVAERFIAKILLQIDLPPRVTAIEDDGGVQFLL